MQPVYIIAAKRTPLGRFNGAMASLSAVQMGAIAIEAALAQSQLDAGLIDEVIMGQVLIAGNGMGPARQAAIQARIPETVPAYSLNMSCGSGMKSVMDATSHIRSGDAEIVIAGGMESMSQAPFLHPSSICNGAQEAPLQFDNSPLKGQQTAPFSLMHMGQTAENVASQLEISRQQQDEFAIESQRKASVAQAQDLFCDEIEPVEITLRHRQFFIEQDESPKADCTLEHLQELRPAYLSGGSVTTGNSSSLNDGAAALVLASQSAVERYKLEPLAEILACGQAGLSPEVMGLGPVPAINNALYKAELSLQEIDCLELNEAFSAQTLGVIQQLCDQHGVRTQWLINRTNPNGGAIALGHPLGASGSRILTSLIYQMKRQNNKYGLASLCIGGGMGTAVIIRQYRK